MTMHLAADAERRRSHRILPAVVAVLLGLVVSAGLIWHASYSAFSSQVSSPSNNWATGTVKLTGDNAGAALFSAANLKPGSTGTKCITVTSTGSLTSVVKLYTTHGVTTNALAKGIDLTITQADGTLPTGGCSAVTGTQIFTGTLDSLEASNTSYSTGLAPWTANGGDSSSKTYQITYTVDGNISNDAQGGTAAVDFVWEAQNN